jgi:tRNA (guanine-N7-)-methyltransferase
MREARERVQIATSRNIPNPHAYVRYLLEDYAQWAFDEERAPTFKGKWREDVFKTASDAPLDLEIGTGIGYYFHHHTLANPGRSLVGLEIRYKPLIQAIRRVVKSGATNSRMARYAGQNVADLFAEGELNDVIIHHPEPWSRPRKTKHRLCNRNLFNTLYKLQKPGSKIEFKTDSRMYFLWAMNELKQTPWVIERYSEDLHQSEWAAEQPLKTHFERIFVSQQVPINYAWLRKPF